MSQISYRANLSAAIFPLSLAQAGRSVIVPGPDNVYDRRVDPEGEQKNAGIPQAIYLENVIPTANGYQSVGYTDIDSTAIIGYNTFDVLFALRFDRINYVAVAYKTGVAFKASGLSGLGDWTDVTFVGTAVYPSSGRITSAMVRGVCYVLIRGASNEMYTATHDGAALTLTNITASLAGVTIADIVEICGSFNYLVLLDKYGSVLWSSTTTPTDFVPSLVSGAGSAAPNGTFSGISNLESTSIGFYLLTKVGILLAQYTGNSRYPWKFTPVTDTAESISFNPFGFNSNGIFSIDATAGIIRVEGNQANKLAPEIASYLRSQGKFDTYNSSTDALSVETSLSTTRPKLYFFYGRYICISCDTKTTNSFESVLIYDIQLRRYGKLKLAHQYLAPYNTGNTEITSLKLGAVHLGTGLCKVLEVDIDEVGVVHSGVLILGKFQYARSRFLQLHSAEIEGTLVDVSIAVLPSLNGKTFETAVAPFIYDSSSSLLVGLCRKDAKNHSLVIKGKFAVESVELSFTPTSDR